MLVICTSDFFYNITVILLKTWYCNSAKCHIIRKKLVLGCLTISLKSQKWVHSRMVKTWSVGRSCWSIACSHSVRIVRSVMLDRFSLITWLYSVAHVVATGEWHSVSFTRDDVTSYENTWHTLAAVSGTVTYILRAVWRCPYPVDVETKKNRGQLQLNIGI